MLQDFARERASNISLQSVSDGRLFVEAVQSEHQRLEIFNHLRYGNQLYIDGDLQISESDRIYGMTLAAPIVADGSCRRLAILGGGDGGVLRELLESSQLTAFSPLETVTLIDVDPNVIALARRYLSTIAGRAFDHARVRVVIGDALSYVRRARGLDAIVCDLTMQPVGAGESRTGYMAALLESIACALRPGGLLSMQAGGELQAEVDELQRLLPENYADVVEQRVLIPSYQGVWVFLAARRRPAAPILRDLGRLLARRVPEGPCRMGGDP